MAKKSNTKEFIEKSINIYGNVYDYSKVVYNGNKSKICIVCSIHGDFWQRPNDHLSNHGCIKCSYNVNDKEIFINNAKIIHKEKYLYDKVVYKRRIDKVIITCLSHGDFLQTPNNHLQGAGCKFCRIELISVPRTDALSFIEKSIHIHNNKYDYSKIQYINRKTKVLIICPKHGEFLQSPTSHLNGRGCSICKSSKGEIKINQVLQNFNITFEKQKSFSGCKSKFHLRFDFYLPDFNCCIEFDGMQHFKLVKYMRWKCFTEEESIINFENIKMKDKIKNDFCVENNIKLIRIPYTQIDKIEEIVLDIIS